MSKLIVYSCVTGSYDKINQTLLASVGIAEPNVSYIVYTDTVSKPEFRRSPNSAITWELRPLVWKHNLCRRRTARWHKVNSHLLPQEAEQTVWIDGSQKIKPVEIYAKLVVPLQAKYVLATFKHPDRSCIYQEMQACIHYHKDNPKLMQKQIAQYRAENYPAYNGMVETACVFRQTCAEVAKFNELWWEQINQHSFRDQLSFNYVAWKLNQAYGIIPGRRDASRFFEFIPH